MAFEKASHQEKLLQLWGKERVWAGRRLERCSCCRRADSQGTGALGGPACPRPPACLLRLPKVLAQPSPVTDVTCPPL